MTTPVRFGRFQPARMTAAAWAALNPVLLMGEPTLETDTGRTKTGNGTGRYNELPYDSDRVAPGMSRWAAAVGARATRNPRLLVIGDSASSESFSWQHQLAGRRYFAPQRANVPDGYLEVEFANGLTGPQIIRFNNVSQLTDIDLLIAPDAGTMGQYRYDEGAWRPAWTAGTVWSDSYPVTALIDRFRIDDMNGANSLSVRANGGAGETFWFGFMATVGDAKLDVMSLAVPAVTSKWWADLLTGPTDSVPAWGNAVPRALAEGFAPDLVIIALGANDLDNPGIINAVDTHLSQIIGAVRDLHPAADIALQTYWQPTWAAVRAQVLATAASEGVALLDFWPMIPTYADHPGIYSDQYHLNAAGHRLVADIAARELGIGGTSETPAAKRTAAGAGAVGAVVFQATTDVEVRLAVNAAPHRIMRPNGPWLGVLADSLESYGTGSISSPGIISRFPLILRIVEWLSHGRMKMTHPQQDPGDTMSDVLNTQLPALLAAPNLPNACVVAIGRNDAGSGFNLATYLSQYTTVALQLFAAGICPIFFTPMPTGAAGSPTAPADPNLRKLAAGLKKLGAQLGVPVFDQYSVLVDESGGLKAIYDQGDHTHLTAIGYQAVAESLVDQGFLDLFPSAMAATVKDIADPNDLLAGAGLFKDVAPAGFSVSGTGISVSYVNASAIDGVAGRLAKVTKVDGTTGTGAYRWTSGAVITPGNYYRLSGGLRLDGAWDADGGKYIQVVAEWRSGTTIVQSDLLMNRWAGLNAVTFSEDKVAPSGVDGLRFVCYLAGTAVGEQNAYLSEWSVRNLTSIGI